MPKTYPVYTYGNVPEKVEAERREAFERLHESARPARFVSDPVIALSIALVEGHQWVTAQPRSSSGSRGRTVFTVLGEQTDPDVDNVRVTLNRIRDYTEEVAAILRIAPEGWQGFFESDRRDPVGSHSQMRIERSIWRDYIDTIDIQTESEQMASWRATCGAGLLKAVPDQDNPYGWGLISVPIDRILWDGAVKTPNFALHKQLADSAAWAAHDVERAYGMKFTNTKNLPALGTLRAFEGTINKIRGAQDLYGHDSKTPGVLLTEFYDDWYRRLTIIIHTGTTKAQSKVVWDGPNPYAKCPFLHLNLGISLVWPLGVGVPMRIRPDQKILNLVITHIVRHLLASGGRWLIEEGTLKNPVVELSPKVGSPIIWRREGQHSDPPKLVQPLEPSVISQQLVTAIPAIMGEKLHIQPVMKGVTSKRGESRAAIVEKLSQAGRTFAQGAETDENRIARFMTHHAKFIANQEGEDKRKYIRMAAGDSMRKTVDDRYEAIGAGEAEALIDANIRVSLPPGTLQPKTPAEKEDRLLKLAALKVFTPERLQWELYRQTKVPVTDEQESAIANAADENLRFLGGAAAQAYEDVPPEMVVDAKNYEPHEIHILVHKLLIRERHTMGVPDEIIQEIQIHIADHFDEQSEEAFQQFSVMVAGQGQPGMTEMANQNLLQESPQSGAMAAPPATSLDYEGRDARARVQQDVGVAPQ